MDKTNTSRRRSSKNSERPEGVVSHEPELMDEKAAARLLRISHRTLQTWRSSGAGPPYHQLSNRCIRYERSEILRWLTSRKRRSTADPGPEDE